MIRGVVNARHEAVVRLRLRGPTGAETTEDVVIDTGFSAALTLPAATVGYLDLIRQTSGKTILADGTVRRFDTYAAEIEWDGAWQTVLAWTIGNDPLVGMRLLAGHDLHIAVVSGGLVEITPLP